MTGAGPDETHDPGLRSWVAGADGHPDFPIQNLPLGIFGPPGGLPRAGTAIGDRILDLRAAGAAGMLPPAAAETLSADCLNGFLALPQAEHKALRHCLSALLSETRDRSFIETILHRAEACALHLPARIGDYTDFYVGIHHARNIGRLFRPDNPLLPNYKHVPIGYHGRASSVRPSGTDIVRPNGQRKLPGQDAPSFGPSQRLDFELELGVCIGGGNELGRPIPIGQAGRHVAGLCLLNDWSARDIQAWEYQPLGPFLAKNFATTVSPWIVTAQALAPFRIAQPARPDGDPRPLPYLWDEADQAKGAFAIDLEAWISSARMREAGMAPHCLSRSAAHHMYWTVAQMVTHHASGGCNLAAGDLLGTGTLSSPAADGFGSLVEMTQGGARTVTLPSGETRGMLEDGDEIGLSARAHAAGFVTIGFGACMGIIKPALLF